MAGRWVRERYQPVSNPAVFSLVHQRLFQDTDPAVAVLLYFALTLPETVKWLHGDVALPTLAIAMIAVALQLISRFVLWRERKSFPIEGHAS